VSPVLAGVLFAVYPAWIFVTAPLFGQLGERIGRLKVLFGGISVLGVSTFVFGMVGSSLELMFLVRSIQGNG